MKELLRLQQHLTALLNTDPAQAIREARRLPKEHVNWKQLRAVILCDAGQVVCDLDAVKEAVQLFTELHGHRPEHGELAYNLANALAASAELDEPHGWDWYLPYGRPSLQGTRALRPSGSFSPQGRSSLGVPDHDEPWEQPRCCTPLD